jgi:predicted MPP superfamily phosphohydrolase
LVRAVLTYGFGLLSLESIALPLLAMLHLGLTANQVYATWVEPFRGSVTSIEISSSKLRGQDSILVLHISDIHFEGWTPRDRWLIETARELEPDMIALTGDYLNLSTVRDRASQEGVREILSSLASIAPTYAVTGSIPVDPPDLVPAIFDGIPIKWLIDKAISVQIGDQQISLIGVSCTRERHLDGPRLKRIVTDHSDKAFQILLYHSPDLMPEAKELGIDLYLAGHTHGGQLCLPLFGAIITSSDFGKKYEGGLYQEESTTLYVSRGLGMEGLGAPRARFLAPPEVGALTLRTDAAGLDGSPEAELTASQHPGGAQC